MDKIKGPQKKEKKKRKKMFPVAQCITDKEHLDSLIELLKLKTKRKPQKRVNKPKNQRKIPNMKTNLKTNLKKSRKVTKILPSFGKTQ